MLRYLSGTKVDFHRSIDRERHTRSSLPDLLRHDPKDRDNLHHDLHYNVSHSRRRSNVDVFLKPVEEEFHAAKQVCKSTLTSADILNSLGVMSPRHPRGIKKANSLGGGHQFQQKWHSPEGIPVSGHVRRRSLVGSASRDSPLQRRYRGSQRMRTRHLQWDPATLSTFRQHFEIGQTSGLGFEARK